MRIFLKLEYCILHSFSYLTTHFYKKKLEFYDQAIEFVFIVFFTCCHSDDLVTVPIPSWIAVKPMLAYI